ncbi:stage II sporulation protein R [Melghirimyces profundicolus]|uniref:Stage II sporulation protein R n=1 Tax=Melghirimyces profundicolus TaxID=1242148 RepID=A0A2T6C2G4_9BACL|nr:stage II sporulation protein R [Melghirimyces profundicolus]PTX62499.1 stage II sporulation protein R [Melghirimyces profundicolus]
MRLRTYSVLILLSVGLFSFLQWTGGGGALTGGTVPVHARSSGENGEIPQQAIRLRILANSDSEPDQRLKQRVRDEIIKEIETWADKPQSLEEARLMIRSRLPLLRIIAHKTVKESGFRYPVKVEFGKVPFPTKLYGDQVYPAGKYEALLITIGEGKGGNWWCVLFPPLCFVDMSNGDAVRDSDARITAGRAMAAPAEQEPGREEEKAEVRFFILDSLQEFFSGLFD